MSSELVTKEEEEHDHVDTFEDLGLSSPLLRSIRNLGYEHPTPIQCQSIPYLLQGRDLIASSQTGTGKTAAFALPILSSLKGKGKLRALILEPTRELAAQVYNAFVEFAKYLDFRFALLQGGVRYEQQRRQIRRGADIMIATPGRLLDFVYRRELSFEHLEVLVLDEADRMLDMGFMPDVRTILKHCPSKRQSVLFSATLQPKIEQLARWMLKNPAKACIDVGVSAAQTVNHAIFPVDERQKFDLLQALLKSVEFKNVIIFVRTKIGTDQIARWLSAAGFSGLVVLHADRRQREREHALRLFKSGKAPILVATDIVSRGIDIAEVSHVINYDIPLNPEDYIHRIGRTGRMYKEGEAITLCTVADRDPLFSIERLIGEKIPHRELEGFNYKNKPVLHVRIRPKSKKRNADYSPHNNFSNKRRSRRRR